MRFAAVVPAGGLRENRGTNGGSPPWMPRPPKPGPTNSTFRTSSISATATSRCWRACTRRRVQGRSRRWSSATAAPGARATASRSKVRHEYMASHGVVSVALDFRSGNEDAVSGVGAGHQLRGALGEAQRDRAQDPSRAGRPVRPVERRASRHAGRHAAARSALHRHRAAGRLARARRHRALRDHVVAGDQSAQPLPAARSARATAPIRRSGRRRSSRARIRSGAARPTWPKATRCSRWSAARRC